MTMAPKAQYHSRYSWLYLHMRTKLLAGGVRTVRVRSTAAVEHDVFHASPRDRTTRTVQCNCNDPGAHCGRRRALTMVHWHNTYVQRTHGSAWNSSPSLGLAAVRFSLNLALSLLINMHEACETCRAY